MVCTRSARLGESILVSVLSLPRYRILSSSFHRIDGCTHTHARTYTRYLPVTLLVATLSVEIRTRMNIEYICSLRAGVCGPMLLHGLACVIQEERKLNIAKRKEKTGGANKKHNVKTKTIAIAGN